MGQQRQSVEKLFGEALDMAPEARRAFLDAACKAGTDRKDPLAGLEREARLELRIGVV